MFSKKFPDIASHVGWVKGMRPAINQAQIQHAASLVGRLKDEHL